ncbi:AV2 protein [Hedyotis uncinella yellow mosaic virus]|uniref:Protein V2 n=1 Tax=Hedyotis uncinella yellow mosaic virus TaxID=1428190 RepID=S5S0Z4_9GEMI|nr:AV2 protein [Hedyotis uncinella yellow mosaic virus]AGS12478.1 AV2 protein [Hedyotis uncinella yellow mosaic virus]
MWDPLLNEFPETVHGLRCMLAIKYCQLVEDTYAPDTIGYDLIRDLISVIRSRSYVEATRRYGIFNARVESTSPSELRHTRSDPCCCPHCPRHKSKEDVDQQAHVSKAQNIQNVQKP